MPVFLAALDMDCSLRIALSMLAPPFPSRGWPLSSSQTLAVGVCFLGEVIECLLWFCGLISCGCCWASFLGEEG